ncbi:hypothetical protein, partial [Nocardia sp. NPDC058497]|uniref:hypothetical protein n=1 Tax=Nocardia sp. NPDC058497 TaxID=3346529 RepID=UPI003665B9CE
SHNRPLISCLSHVFIGKPVAENYRGEPLLGTHGDQAIGASGVTAGDIDIDVLVVEVTDGAVSRCAE